MKRFYSIVFYVIGLALLSLPLMSMLRCSSSKGSEQASKKILFAEDFENNKPFQHAYNVEVGNWNYALQYVTTPVYQGKKVARFEIHKDQPLVKKSKRAEVTIIKELPGNNMWYSFAVYFPEVGFEIDTEREIINQWYQDGTPATSLRVKNDTLYLETGPTPEQRIQLDIGPTLKNKWHEIVLHFIHAHNNEGLVEVWHNGKKVITHQGGNMYDNVLPKWKVGIYKAAFKFGTSKRERRVAYFDNIKVGSSEATYEDMIPSKMPKQE